MISLKDYALDKLFINEGFFQAKDYSHRGDYKYVKKLFQYLLGEIEDLTLNVCTLEHMSNKSAKVARATTENSITLTSDDFNKEQILKAFNNPKSALDIDFSKYTTDDISNILKNSLNDKYEQLKKLSGKFFYRLDKLPFSGVKVTTRDQEVTTCVLFNTLVGELKSLNEFDNLVNETNNKENISRIKSIISLISNKYDNSWVRSFMYQMQAVSNIIKEENNISNFKKLKMERYGGDKNYDDWKLSKLYSSVISSYSSKLYMQKDSLDPTDVILFNIDNENDISDILKNSLNHIKNTSVDTDNHNADYANFKKEFLKLYNVDVTDNEHIKNIFFKGISLKKLSGGYKIDKFNITENTEFIFNSLEETGNLKYHEADKTIFCIVKGKIENKKNDSHIITSESMNMPGEQQEIKTDVLYRYKICLRSNGNKIACDVAQCKRNDNKSYTTGPSLGKCPVKVWNDILKPFIKEGYKSSPNSSDIKIYKSAFSKMCDLPNNELTNILNDMITSAIKCGPNCLPFIIIH